LIAHIQTKFLTKLAGLFICQQWESLIMKSDYAWY